MKTTKTLGIILLALVITACAGGDCDPVPPKTVVSSQADVAVAEPVK